MTTFFFVCSLQIKSDRRSLHKLCGNGNHRIMEWLGWKGPQSLPAPSLSWAECPPPGVLGPSVALGTWRAGAQHTQLWAACASSLLMQLRITIGSGSCLTSHPLNSQVLPCRAVLYEFFSWDCPDLKCNTLCLTV